MAAGQRGSGGLRRHPRPRGPHRRPAVPAGSPVVPGVRIGVHARSGAAQARRGGPARPGRAPRGSRRGPLQRRAVRVRGHAGHPLGARRLHHRLLHASGADPALQRLQARPHARGRQADGSVPHRFSRRRSGGAAAAGRLHQRGRPRVEPVRAGRGRCAARHDRPPGGTQGDRRCLRQPHPPHPASDGRGGRRGGAPWPRWACRCSATWAWPASWG